MRFILLALCLLSIASAQTWKKLPASALKQAQGLPETLRQVCQLAENESFGPPDTIFSPGGMHLHFAQYRNGEKVHQAGVTVTIDRAGRVVSLSDATLHLPSGTGAWTTDPGRMHIRYLRALGATRVQVDRAWMAHGDSLLPCWLVTTFQPGTVASYEIAVDARSGKELSREDRGVHFCLSRRLCPGHFRQGPDLPTRPADRLRDGLWFPLFRRQRPAPRPV